MQKENSVFFHISALVVDEKSANVYRVSYPKEGQFLFSNLDNFAKWDIKILIFAAIIDTY
jgi:hypothetical protein